MNNDRLRLLFCDHLNLARGKYLPGEKMKSNGSSRFAQALFGVHFDKDLLPSPGSRMLEGAPDMVAVYKKSEIRAGWQESTKVVVADLQQADGTPVPMCGRTALKKAVKDWQKHGFTPKVGLEIEAYAFTRGEDGAFKPYDTPHAYVYSPGPFSDPRGFTEAIWNASNKAGFKLESFTTEYDSPQFEFTLKFDDAVQAVDEHFLFRLMAREIALEHGIILTCMPKPIVGKGGSGTHVNFSFNNKQGKNVLGVSGAPDKMSKLARGCVAGLMRHHRGMSGLIAPIVNSYERLKPASMSGYWCNWGGDHRGVTTRVSNETGPRARLEHRMGDGAANPYVLVATVLQAARLGFENDYALAPMETGDCFEHSSATSAAPDNLAEAMDELEKDTALCTAVGQVLCDNQIFMKRAEVEKTSKLEGETLRDWYMYYI
ncbi:MAG: glutamine synthetase [Alphaproteobacteria bacterium]|nr:glutamine synthetase [Alphaproteobacteria bacterium]